MSLSVLGSCASCAEQTDATLCCAGCHTLYCSRECQKVDWKSGGHKKACAGIARARRDTNLEVQSRALGRVSHMSGGAPGDARCLFCLDGGDAEDPLMRGCACRGSFGWTHAPCLVQSAEARAPLPGQPIFAAWAFCSTCKQAFTGLVRLRLAIALWAKHAREVETDEERLAAVNVYAMAIEGAGEHAEAARLERVILDARSRTLGPEHRNTLTAASNLGASLLRLGEHAEAAVLLRTTLAAWTRALGPDDEGTLDTENILIGALLHLGRHVEAEALCQGTLEKMRRVLGRDHGLTLATSGNFAVSLKRQGKYAEAVDIEREALILKTRLLGAEHEQTLLSAINLANSLLNCGQNAEAEQLYSRALALSRRSLGPTHKLTQCVLWTMRTLGLATR